MTERQFEEQLADDYARHLAGELTDKILLRHDLWGSPNYDRNARVRERRWRRRVARLVEVADE